MIHWNSQIKFQVVWTLKIVLDRFPSFCVVSDFDCLLSFNYRLFFLKRLGSSEFFKLHYIDSTHFYQLPSILWVVPNSVQNQNQHFCTTATKVILPSATYQASAVDNFALYVLLTNFCSWKIVLRNLVAQKTLHKEISTCHVSCENCSKLLGVCKATNPLKMHFIVNSYKVHLNAFLILCPG